MGEGAKHGFRTPLKVEAVAIVPLSYGYVEKSRKSIKSLPSCMDVNKTGVQGAKPPETFGF